MEELTKTQLILLALLVSFVTSIATGIATASLIDQAPPRVEQVINRVVERTVEKVVQSEKPDVITREETIVVKEEDLITQTVNSTSAGLVRIYSSQEATPVFLGLGFRVSSEGLVVTAPIGLSEGLTYNAKLSDGKEQPMKVIRVDSNRGIAALEPISEEGVTPPDSTALLLGDTSALKLGQTVFAVGGEINTTVSSGIISRIDTLDLTPEAEEPTLVTSHILTSIDSGSLLVGTPLVNLFGEIIGFRGSSLEEGFTPAMEIDAFLDELAS